ncbi:wD repeat domain, partial [Characodon lateralis]|nr:wD repeat domain [Characodon lateralis]
MPLNDEQPTSTSRSEDQGSEVESLIASEPDCSRDSFNSDGSSKQCTPSSSPPKAVSLHEVMEAGRDLFNLKLAHEIIINDFHMDQDRGTQSSLWNAVRDNVHKAFWDILEAELNEDPPEYQHAIKLLEEIREILLSFLNPGANRMRTKIMKVLDMDLIRQQAENDAVDIQGLASYIITTMGKMCAPMRDEEIRNLRESTDNIVTLLKEIFRVLNIMRADAVNQAIQSIKPLLQRNRVEYERETFQSILDKTPTALNRTTSWIQSTLEELLPAIMPPGKSDDAGKSQRALPGPIQILNTACLRFLTWDFSKALVPETWVIDESRLEEIQWQLKQCEMVNEVLLIVHSTVGGPIQGISSLSDRLKRMIGVLLEGMHRPGFNLGETLEGVSSQICCELNKSLIERNYPSLTPEVQATLTGQICSISQKDNPIRTLVEDRVQQYFMVLLSNPKTHNKLEQVPAGLTAIKPELVQIGKTFISLIDYNRAVYGPFYMDIIRKLLFGSRPPAPILSQEQKDDSTLTTSVQHKALHLITEDNLNSPAAEWSVTSAQMALEERARSSLLRLRLKLEQDIKPQYLMDHMISDGVITLDEEEKIRIQPTRKDQAAALIELLLRRDNRCFISFYNALVKETYDDLAKLLYADLPDVSRDGRKSPAGSSISSVQIVLSEGGVPQRPVVFVSRPELLNQVRKKLYLLQEDAGGWVTVFGMAGSGKSVLAAEAVRDHGLIQDCFPQGVHWLSIGQLDKPDLLVKVQSLCFRLEQSLDSQSHHRPPTSLDEAKERLRFLMLRRYPRSLLILDDIWDSSVLKVFDIHCRILLTTRNRSLADSVSGPKYEVEVESGLDDKKALEILALYTKKNPSTLPAEACSIVRECKGSPLVVSLIGALLNEKPNRWLYYLRQLQQKQFKRIRKSSSYDYDALDQAMAASIEVLPDEHREFYKDLTVLEKDVKIPAKVLSVLWDLEPEEVEDILQEFVNRSLLFVDCNSKPPLYYLHDLQLDFLAEQNRDQIESLHGKVVCQYQHHYREASPVSGDKECLYWIRFLPYHMAKANMSQELYSLMLSLDWVSIKAKIMGAAHLINDYVEYGPILDKENSELRSQFQEFLSLSGHHLEQRPFPDVLQLALSQPHSSGVYRQARQQALNRANRGKLYFELINKSSVENLSRLVIHPHQGSIYSARFSHDGTKVASCGASKMLKVFKSTSGEKLTEIQAHDDEVLCCAFSPDDHLIATCSSDRKIKVWNIQQGKLLRVFEDEHEEQVNHCEFTNTARRLLLATCSNDSCLNVKIWNLNKPSSQNTMFGHFKPVNHCCFSPDDSYLSTSSNDGTVKLFQVSTANEWKTIDVKTFFSESDDEEVLVKCSTWTADGTRIICAARNAALVFDVQTSDMLLEIKTNRLSTVQYCHTCPTSNLLALAFSNYAVELWDLEENKKRADCSGHLSWVQRVQFSNDGLQLLSCSDDQTVRLWETEKVHTSSAICLKRDSDVLFNEEEIIVSAADNCNRLQVRDGRTGSVRFQSEELPFRIRCTCMCRNPFAVSLGQENGNVQVLELPSGKLLATLLGHTKTVLHCQFCQNGQTLITSSEDTTIR